jgi:hypothetical protein
MKMKVQVIIESDNGQKEVIQDVVALEHGPLQPEELGLTDSYTAICNHTLLSSA